MAAVIDLRDAVPARPAIEPAALQSRACGTLHRRGGTRPTTASGPSQRCASRRWVRQTPAHQIACDGVFHERRLGTRRAAALPGRDEDALRRGRAPVRPRHPADGVFACGRVNGIYTPAARLLDGDVPAARRRRIGASARRRPVRVPAEASRRPTPGPCVPSEGQEFRRLRRGSAGRGSRERHSGGLRQHRADEALLAPSAWGRARASIRT